LLEGGGRFAKLSYALEQGAEEAGAEEAGAEEAGAEEAGAEDRGAEEAGAEEAGAEDEEEAGAEDRGEEEAGAEDRGAEEAGAEDRGAEEAGAEDRGAEDEEEAGAEDRGAEDEEEASAVVSAFSVLTSATGGYKPPYRSGLTAAQQRARNVYDTLASVWEQCYAEMKQEHDDPKYNGMKPSNIPTRKLMFSKYKDLRVLDDFLWAMRELA
jgi:hypothetical protein